MDTNRYALVSVLFLSMLWGCGDTPADRLAGPSASLSASPLPFAQIHAGYLSTCAVDTGGNAYCWGNNSLLQAGGYIGVHRLEPLLLAYSYSPLSVGAYHACAVNNGRPRCWGFATYGQTGESNAYASGSWSDSYWLRSLAGPDTVAAGYSHSCSIAAHDVYCWGSNEFGQLGTDLVGQLAECAANRDDCTATPGRVPLPDVAPRGLAAGALHTCAITTGGQTYCWGRNDLGQLGAATASTSVRSPTRVATDLRFVALSAGASHTCGRATDARIYCWGDNSRGQLGNGTRGGHTSIPTRIESPNFFSAVSAGASHTCAIDTRGQALCWGDGSWGNLGLGRGTDTPVPWLVAGGHTFEKISAGLGHTCALTPAGEAYCWGNNAYGQLGNGTTTPSSVPVATL